jgi:hypothetical protein
MQVPQRRGRIVALRGQARAAEGDQDLGAEPGARLRRIGQRGPGQRRRPVVLRLGGRGLSGDVV